MHSFMKENAYYIGLRKIMKMLLIEKGKKKEMKVLCTKIRKGQRWNDDGTKERGRLQCRINSIGSAPNGAILTERFPTGGHMRNRVQKIDNPNTQGIIVCTGQMKVKTYSKCLIEMF